MKKAGEKQKMETGLGRIDEQAVDWAVPKGAEQAYGRLPNLNGD